MKIAILGVGSIGGIILGSLADSEAELVCVSRGVSHEFLESGLTLFTPQGSMEMIPGERYSLFDSENGTLPKEVLGSCEVAIICSKAESTAFLASMAEDLIAENGIAVSIQNGLGHAEIISSRVGKIRVVGGSTTHSAWRDNDGSVHWTGRGKIELGRFDGGEPGEVTERFISILEESGLSPRWSYNIEGEIWRKLLINVAINPVCAIAGVRNGALTEIPELWEQAVEIMREAELVALELGVDLGLIDNEEYLKSVIISTSENRVSMLQDLMSGRKTEIEALCGEIVSIGERLGIPTPKNGVLLALVKGIEMSQHFD